jgi:hypothetical protein
METVNMELIDVLRKALTEPQTFAELRDLTGVHDVVLTIALRTLHASGEAACGFVTSDGEWSGEEPVTDQDFFVAWHISEERQMCACRQRTLIHCQAIDCIVDDCAS